MRIKTVFVILLIFHFSVLNIAGQEKKIFKENFPRSISFSYGIGSFAVKDHFFSYQKYTGSMPTISLEWMQPHDRYGYRMGFEYLQSDDIQNHTISATVTQFSFYQDFLYSLGKFSLFKKDVYAYLGPSVDYYFYYNQQKFAGTGIYFDFSFLTTIAAAADVYLNMPIGKRWNLETNLRLNILSLGLQMPEIMLDVGEEAGTTIKLLTPFNGLKTNFDIGSRFLIVKWLSVRLVYRLEITNITIRKQVSTVSDNLIGTLVIQF